ncbi:MAG: DUF1156 domain-containing protein [Acidimicrobiia bacterium]|nr:DUF1156 domain-containing protein [Acidimicrobiia bacterium]
MVPLTARRSPQAGRPGSEIVRGGCPGGSISRCSVGCKPAAVDPFPRKLIEVALPLEAVNAAGRAEKAVPKKGHPATMHLWWSRKPLGVTRAALFASLVDDPSARPDLYPTEAAQQEERRRLLALIEQLCRWERSADPALLAEAQRCIAASAGDRPPRIIDPFCGGGAISTEAIRLGLDTLAIDLNPVAALVSSATLSVAQRFAGQPAISPGDSGGDGTSGIAADVAHYGEAVEDECRRRLAGVFPAPSGHSPSGYHGVAVSYLWARTITCADPACGRTTPLLSTWWLSKKPTNRWHARPVVEGDRFGFVAERGPPPADLADLKVGRGANYRCLHCGTVNDADVVRRCGRGAGFGLRLVAVQGLADPRRPRAGRVWFSPDEPGERAGLAGAPVGFPDAVEAALRHDLPEECGNVTAFGLRTFADVLSPRQRRTMATFAEVISDMTPVVHRDALSAGLADDGVGVEQDGSGARAYAEAVITYLAVALSRMANRTTTMTTHNRANGSVEQSFIRPAYGFYGEFAEANPFSGSTGSWAGGLGYVVRAMAALPASGGPPADSALRDSATRPGAQPPEAVRVARADVRCGSMLGALDGAAGVVCTDPPYYDMFDYAALSNLFLVWLRAALGDVWPETLGPPAAPAAEQIVANAARSGGDRAAAHERFEKLLRLAFERMRAVHDRRYPLTVFYGYRQSETTSSPGTRGSPGTAWEALLESLIAAGYRVTASWPLRTERPEGVKKGTKSLASSVLLVCRPVAGPDSVRPAATVGDLRSALRAELPGAVRMMQQADVAPLDLVQAVIGPGMAVFTRFDSVLTADGSPLGVRAVLAMINEVLDETLTGAGAELDATTRWALAWFDEHGFAEGSLGRAEQLSKERDISLAGPVAAGIVVTDGERVRLRRSGELDTGQDRIRGGIPTVWEATQQLLRHVSDGGEQAAAVLLSRLDADTADAARDLAYRLFQICTRRNLSAEAAACNGLVNSWPELCRLAAGRG